MQWELIDYETSTGKYNMDFDLKLSKICKPGIPLF